MAGGAWQYNVIHTFTGSGEGCLPLASLVRDSTGHFYGTTVYGGSYGGSVFEITPQ